MIDIDHFKSVNDTYGHHAGDLVLKDVAQLLQRSLREVDVAARWGGEEFVVVLPAVGMESAIIPAQRILEAVAENAFPEIPGRAVTVSIGCASAPHPLVDCAQQLVHLADVALYQAKRLGRNRLETAPEETLEGSVGA